MCGHGTPRRRRWPRACAPAAAPDRRGRDERGAALTMWVLLMVPVASFAALVAMAGPQRLAARSDMADAADDLAHLAVGLRQGYGDPDGELSAFSMSCALDAVDESAKQSYVADRATAAQNLVTSGVWAGPQPTDAELDLLLEKVALGNPLSTDEQDYYDAFIAHSEIVAKPEACRRIVDAVLRDLGTEGVASNELGGFYSDSLKHTDRQVFVDGGGTPDPAVTTDAGWVSDPTGQTSCAVSPQVVVHDAVQVSVAGEWIYAGWAAAQVWPDGSRMAAESIGRYTVRNPRRAEVLRGAAVNCKGTYLEALDSQGRPAWAESPTAASRELAQKAGRSILGE